MSYDINTDAAIIQAALGAVPQLLTAQAADPAVAAADKINLYAKKMAERVVPFVRGPSGAAMPLQGALWGHRVGDLRPNFSSSILSGSGLSSTALGTNTAQSLTTTNMFTRMPRLDSLSAAISGSIAGHRGGYFCTTGDGAGLGGFFFSTRFGIADAVAVSGALMFCGLRNSNASIGATTDPATLTGSIGIGHGASDTNLRLYYGGTSAQTPIDLGANFPTNTLSTDVYELTLFSPADASGVVYYRVERINTGHVATGTLTGGAAVLPAASVLLTYHLWRSNNATALAVNLSTMHIYKSTDN